MGLSPKSLAGPGYIVLNAIRIMNIIGFLAVITASILMLVRTSTRSSFFFFDAVSHVVTASTSTFLIVSELCLFPGYFERNWPLLSPTHGFVMLSLMMVILGLDILGNLNKAANSQAALGLAFWRVVISAGILIFILGFINLLASYVFRDKTHGITARMVRAHGAVADQETPQLHRNASMATKSTLSSPYTPTKASPSPTVVMTAANLKNPLRLITTKFDPSPDSVLPSYHSSPINKPSGPSRDEEHHHHHLRPASPPSPSSRYSRATACTKKGIFASFYKPHKRDSLAPPLPLNISAPMGTNPQFKDWVVSKSKRNSGGAEEEGYGVGEPRRPDSAFHPAREGWKGRG